MGGKEGGERRKEGAYVEEGGLEGGRVEAEGEDEGDEAVVRLDEGEGFGFVCRRYAQGDGKSAIRFTSGRSREGGEERTAVQANKVDDEAPQQADVPPRVLERVVHRNILEQHPCQPTYQYTSSSSLSSPRKTI